VTWIEEGKERKRRFWRDGGFFLTGGEGCGSQQLYACAGGCEVELWRCISVSIEFKILKRINELRTQFTCSCKLTKYGEVRRRTFIKVSHIVRPLTLNPVQLRRTE
jgi:hypothetical protein